MTSSDNSAIRSNEAKPFVGIVHFDIGRKAPKSDNKWVLGV
jgi:hypothetical protein